MRVAAYQFAVSSDIDSNISKIKSAIINAAEQEVELLVFPECALTGYPPRDIKSSSVVDFNKLENIYVEIQEASNLYNITLIIGTITKKEEKLYNTAMIFSPFLPRKFYDKRALWGWDRDNFEVGKENDIVKINGWKIGIRICFEVRFPEFFRELYSEQTDLNVIMFYDVSDYDDTNRYQIIKSHLVTRAVENVTYTLAVNAISPYQTAPTVLLNRSGNVIEEISRNEEGLLIYDLEKGKMDFGEQGRKELSDWLTGEKITLCGDNCMKCPRYLAKTEEELKSVAELWYRVGWRDVVESADEISCTGCSSHKKCTYNLVNCIKEHNVEKCNQCSEYPCNKIRDMLKRSQEYKEKCKDICSEEEYALLEKAFFQKEKNLEK